MDPNYEPEDSEEENFVEDYYPNQLQSNQNRPNHLQMRQNADYTIPHTYDNQSFGPYKNRYSQYNYGVSDTNAYLSPGPSMNARPLAPKYNPMYRPPLYGSAEWPRMTSYIDEPALNSNFTNSPQTAHSYELQNFSNIEEEGEATELDWPDINDPVYLPHQSLSDSSASESFSNYFEANENPITDFDEVLRISDQIMTAKNSPKLKMRPTNNTIYPQSSGAESFMLSTQDMTPDADNRSHQSSSVSSFSFLTDFSSPPTSAADIIPDDFDFLSDSSTTFDDDIDVNSSSEADTDWTRWSDSIQDSTDPEDESKDTSQLSPSLRSNLSLNTLKVKAISTESNATNSKNFGHPESESSVSSISSDMSQEFAEIFSTESSDSSESVKKKDESEDKSDLFSVCSNKSVISVLSNSSAELLGKDHNNETEKSVEKKEKTVDSKEENVKQMEIIGSFQRSPEMVGK